ncbi:hypothetical protein CTI12_AA576050 [Artemisia annua]|uniref:Uncharacterized protein n=1 Tax=Artemisia annua TaxID=35608 RepID=A0A2U1KQI5_ARTAN|nr:hypothetical protein CTI12_AA576050 [Artemisia annua]
MSLVDYDASSSDEEEEQQQQQQHQTNPPNEKSAKLPVPQSDHPIKQSEPSTFKLPDASFLLDSPTLPSNMSGSYDHTSRVAAAMAQNASRKRDSKESASSYPRGKIPKGNLPHSKIVPETARGLLRPPQLSGRSNVVTEDINKLFTRRNGSEPSSSRPPSEP